MSYSVLYSDGYLCHHGIMGQKWGVRRWQYSDGSLTPDGRIHYNVGPARDYHQGDTVFISGKVKYDKPLNRDMRREMDNLMRSGSKVIIGDAPGADTRVQDYMAKKGYKNVVVYTTDPQARNNVGNWEVKRISGKGYKDEAAIRRQKDIAMTKAASRAFAIMPEDDRPDSAMSRNVERLSKAKKYTKIYDYNKHKWIIK